MFFLYNSELRPLGYGFRLGWGRVSLLSLANRKDEGLYIIQ